MESLSSLHIVDLDIPDTHIFVPFRCVQFVTQCDVFVKVILPGDPFEVL